MTDKDIILMAQKAKMPYYFGTSMIPNFEAVKRFAKLVYEQAQRDYEDLQLLQDGENARVIRLERQG